MTMWWRKLVYAAVALGLGTVLPLLALEGLLRFLPVHTGLNSVAVNAAQPVYHFRPNQNIVYSKNWDFGIVSRRRINNVGFVNDQDYDSADPRPLLALVGDSFVEAVQVSYGESAAGRLAKAAGSGARVYSFAAGASPYSQYLVWADYARRKFHPAGLVVSIVNNDYDQALMSVQKGRPAGPFPGMCYFMPDPAAPGGMRLDLVELPQDRWRSLLSRSALLGYVVRNMNIGTVVAELSQRFKTALHPPPQTNGGDAAPPPPVAFVANAPAQADEKLLADSRQGAIAFLEQLPAAAGLPPSEIVLTLDAIRPEIYAPDRSHFRDSYVGRMRRFMMAEAQARGFEVIDLEPWFVAAAQSGRRFEFWQNENLIDNHWNADGHAVMAEAVVQSALFKRRFAPVP